MTAHHYFLGIGGTLMGSLAQLAKASGLRVSGSDNAIYPPMSDQLAAAGIQVFEGFDPAQLQPAPDMVVLGNAKLPRGHPGVEYILRERIPFMSGAEWLATQILHDRWVLAVTGTHGKTTTTSMLAWILEHAGFEPGYLIGGVPGNFEHSARLGSSAFFVVEADEYDTSYFDRRAKFVHYQPRTLIINNLEYDHADIYSDLKAIQQQFNHLLRTVPDNGLIIAPSDDDAVNDVLQAGCWTPVARIGDDAPRLPIDQDTGDLWSAQEVSSDASEFDVELNGTRVGRVAWHQMGQHNVRNALNAVAAAQHVGVLPETAVAALGTFTGVKRRMELIHDAEGVRVYDDFAHHPTAIRKTLEGLRRAVHNDEIVAVIEPRSHTMSLGTLRHDLTTCGAAADRVIWFRGDNIRWDLNEVVQDCVVEASMFDDLDKLIEHLATLPPKPRHIVLMSNGAFGGIHQALPERLKQG